MRPFVETKVVASHDVENQAQLGWHVIDHFSEQYVETNHVSRDCGGQGSNSNGGNGCIHGYNYNHQYSEETYSTLTQRKFLMGRPEESLVNELQCKLHTAESRVREATDETVKLAEQVEAVEKMMDDIEPELQRRVTNLEAQFDDSTTRVLDLSNRLSDTQKRLEERDQQLGRLRKHFDDDDYFKSVASGEPPPQVDEEENATEKRFSLLELGDWKNEDGNEAKTDTKAKADINAGTATGAGAGS